MNIAIDYRPRAQFIPYHRRTARFSVLVCHRRAGKTVACVHDLLKSALETDKPSALFAYIAPYLSQAKTVAWKYLKEAVFPLMRYGAKINESELRVDLPNGSQIRLWGGDHPDALRGVRLDGVILDEGADMDPRLWSEVLRPALSDRKGWATFIGTPKGRNDFYELYERAKADPTWYHVLMRADETKLIDPEELELARKDLSEDQFAQEFLCNFNASFQGSYYARLIQDAEDSGRICGVPYDPASQVYTAWDLGVRDSTAIVWMQQAGKEVHVIDAYEASGVGLDHYVAKIKEKNYNYGSHILPHDIRVRELSTGKTRMEILESMGLRGKIEIAPQHTVEDGINGVRVFLPRCYFDLKKTKILTDALRNYRSEYNDKLQALRPAPLHDWTSHFADAFRYGAMTFDQRTDRTKFMRKLEYPKIGVA